MASAASSTAVTSWARTALIGAQPIITTSTKRMRMRERLGCRLESRRSVLMPCCPCLGKLLMQVGLDERVDRAVQHRLSVADADLGAMVGHLGVRVQHVRADAIAKSGRGVLSLDAGSLVRLLVHLPLQ